MRHHVLISGSANSLAAAWVVASRCKEERMAPPWLIFADTGLEHPDTYRLVHETLKAAPQSQMVWLEDIHGRTPLSWASQMTGARKKPYSCCQTLKHDAIDNWLKANAADDDIVNVGILWPERCKFFGSPALVGLKKIKADQGFRYEAPLCDLPYWSSQDVSDLMAELKVVPHVLDGAVEHKHCGGFCYVNGPRQWREYLTENREHFLDAEERTKSLSIVYDGGKSSDFSLPMASFRHSQPGRGLHLPREQLMCFSSCLEPGSAG